MRRRVLVVFNLFGLRMLKLGRFLAVLGGGRGTCLELLVLRGVGSGLSSLGLSSESDLPVALHTLPLFFRQFHYTESTTQHKTSKWWFVNFEFESSSECISCCYSYCYS
jgi:hypothetical protein